MLFLLSSLLVACGWSRLVVGFSPDGWLHSQQQGRNARVVRHWSFQATSNHNNNNINNNQDGKEDENESKVSRVVPLSPPLPLVPSMSTDNLILEETYEEGEEEPLVVGWITEKPTKTVVQPPKRHKMELMWCNSDVCKDTIRERVVSTGTGEANIVLTGPATGQVAYSWVPVNNNNNNCNNNNDNEEEEWYLDKKPRGKSSSSSSAATIQSVLLLLKPGDEELLEIAAHAVQEWISTKDDSDMRIRVLLDPSVAAKLEYHYGVKGLDKNSIQLFEAARSAQPTPDLICTLGGDGLLMYAAMLFQGPSPPILCVSGGSLGFLTPFQTHEMVDAVRVALGFVSSQGVDEKKRTNTPFAPSFRGDIAVYPPNMPTYPYEPLLSEKQQSLHPLPFAAGDRMCLSIRMRLQCRILNRQGVCRAEYAVLNEVVIDRGSSPYLAALECFCDDHHLTTVQADGIIFATPTGSTAYSMAAGGSVVHPAVPCILVTPICPHVLSFRSMIFPDHVILQCLVPDDARAEASVAFDGKHRQPLHRGDCVEISMSKHPVPTLNRLDHSSDWLSSLKRNFGFNARPRQRPLSL